VYANFNKFERFLRKLLLKTNDVKTSIKQNCANRFLKFSITNRIENMSFQLFLSFEKTFKFLNWKLKVLLNNNCENRQIPKLKSSVKIVQKLSKLVPISHTNAFNRCVKISSHSEQFWKFRLFCFSIITQKLIEIIKKKASNRVTSPANRRSILRYRL